MKWPKSGEIPSRFSQIPSDYFALFTCCGAAAALFRKFGGLESSLRLTDGDYLLFCASFLLFWNPLIESCPLVPFPPPNAQGMSVVTLLSHGLAAPDLGWSP